MKIIIKLNSNIEFSSDVLTKYTQIPASTAFQITVTTGSTGAATATVDVFGYIQAL